MIEAETEEQLRDDFEFFVFRRWGGWPTRNERGEYKKARNRRLWQEWLAEPTAADAALKSLDHP